MKKILLSLSLVILLSGCGLLNEELTIFSKPAKIEFLPPPMPRKPMFVDDVPERLITSATLQKVLEDVKKKQGDDWLLYCVNNRVHEAITLNINELRRYSLDLKSMVQYYQRVLNYNKVGGETKKKESK